MSENTMLPVVADRNKHVLFQTERGGAVYRMKAAKYADLGSDDKRIADDDTEVVCGGIDLLFRTEKLNERGKPIYGLEVEFPVAWDGSTRIRTQVTRGELCTGNSAAIARLADLGLDVQMTSKNGTPPLAAYLYYYPAQTLPPLKLFDQGGWTDETFTRFLFKNATIEADGLPGAAGMAEGDDCGIDLNKRGTLEAWQAGVATRARHSRTLRFALCVPLASVLTPLMDAEVTVFHLRVRTGKGKSSAAIGAASVFGVGKPAALDGSSTAAQSWAASYNHVGYLFDELGQMKPEVIKNIAYVLGNGMDKQRLDRSGKPRKTKKFRFIGLSYGEDSYAAIRKKALGDLDKGPASGELSRFISLHALSEYGVFDSLPSEELTAGDPGSDYADQYQTAAKENTGHAGERFIRLVIEDIQQYGVDKFRELLHSKAEEFFRHCPPAAHKNKRMMKRFAPVAVAGEMAIEYGIFGDAYRPGDMIETVRHFVRVWLESDETAEGRADALVDGLTEFMLRNPRDTAVYFVDLLTKEVEQDLTRSILHGRVQVVLDKKDKEQLLLLATREQWKDLLPKISGGLNDEEATEALLGRAILLEPAKSERPLQWEIRRTIKALKGGKRYMVFVIADSEKREQAMRAVDLLFMNRRKD